MGKILVVVESPAKIKKFNDILGSKYKTMASVGHIIDLDPKKMSVDLKTFIPTYITIKGKDSVVEKLKEAYAKADDILLASDLDREGEAISWTIKEVLKLKNPKRITTDSITKEAILKAVENPRKIDMNLVHSQQARRILDRIIGYEISPILWKTIGMALSAGRVQSVVVRLIVERETEITKFFNSKLMTFFKITALFEKNIKADLVENKKIVKIDNIDDARDIINKCSKSDFKVTEISKKDSYRNPPPPFTTASLQQEASRKLSFNVKKTMAIAQHLYEEGYITYMRTDSINISKEGMKEIKESILELYGSNYYREKIYKSKGNTQEAHECIRPTHPKRKSIAENKYGDDGKRLYNLIWKRTMACQMSPAKLEITTILIDISKVKKYKFMSEFENVIFDGFLKIYEKEEETKTVKVKEGDMIDCKEIKGTQEYKKPPTRFDEASLVKQMSPEHLNIGRPSTYGNIIEKIQDRNYVKKTDIDGVKVEQFVITWNGKKILENKTDIILGKETNKLVPTNLGVIVTEFLIKYFNEIMDYEFTAEMEKSLDNIAEGKLDHNKLLKNFYKKFHPLVEKLIEKSKELKEKNTRILGKHPKNGYEITTIITRFGPAIKMCNPENKKDCVFAPIKEPLTIGTITLKDAIQLLEYPKLLGKYNEEDVKISKGKFGIYIKHGKKNISIGEKSESDITLEEAIKLIKEKEKGELWKAADKKASYVMLEGKYGRYVNVKPKKGKSINVKVPDDVKEMTIEKVQELLENKKKSRRRFIKKK